MALFRFLHSLGEITREEADALRERSRNERLHPIEALAGRIQPERVAEILTSQLGLPLIDLGAVSLSADALERVPKELAVRYDAIPIRLQRGRLVVAFANPLDAEVIRAIEFSTRTKVEAAVASLGQVRDAIRQHYLFDEELRSMLERAVSRDGVEVVEPNEDDDSPSLLEQGGEQKAAVVRLVELLLVEGLRLGASDVHIEPTCDGVAVRHRVHGVLEPGITFPKALQPQVVARIKVMARLDITERRRPQDGALRLTHQGRHVDVRVSVLPTPLGEKVVLRLLDPEAKGHSLESLGLRPQDLGVLRREGRRPEGLILISGPTGSGKSTTAHAILSEIADSRLNIVTIENPVEHRIAGVTQVEVNEKQGVTFAGTLRSVLRQDPDVIFVGEIRDAETARIALQAAQTGHLVLTTVHTIDAAASITRLLDLGLDPLLVAASLRLVIAQRLVRVLCGACAGGLEPAREADRERIARHGRIEAAARAVGCRQCRETGYAGRMGVYEVVPVSPGLRGRIERGEPESALRAEVRAGGVPSLPAEAVRLVGEGRTTVDEVLRVIPPEDAPEDPREQVPGKAGASGALSRADAPKGPFRVLVVDDDPELIELTRRCLERGRSGVEVIGAPDGTEAMRLLGEQEIHLVLLDIGMPGPSGLELCARIRQHPAFGGVPILMLTGRDETGSRVEAFRAGADDYIVKPAVPAELLARIDRALLRSYGRSPGLRAAERGPDEAPVERAPGSPATAAERPAAAGDRPAEERARPGPRPLGVGAPGPAAAREAPAPRPSASEAWQRFVGRARAG